ncbi:MAG: hypothetical protein LUC44_07515 [Prevotellaceae bacterium]|nr:hypothetical protein [Prevotellaceae bacterium]
MRKHLFNFLMLMAIATTSLVLFSCSDDDDNANHEHDKYLCHEWVEITGNYYADYYYFNSNGTGIHGSYDQDLDWLSEDDDISWYTIDEYLYIDGAEYKYSIDGSNLEMTRNGRTRTYYER